ncbi:MAG: hypothetical protein AAFY70_00500 [Bacteroidota bacterium]
MMKQQSNQHSSLRLTQLLFQFGPQILIILSGMAIWASSQRQHIGGIVNDYARVIQVSSRSVTLDNSAAFGIGDKVLIIQMNGAQISTANDESYGDVQSLNHAGNYEFVDVVAVKGNQLILDQILEKAYDARHAVQAVRVPVYSHARIQRTLRANPWNGEKGGIISIWVKGTLTLSADVRVDNAGFRGAQSYGSSGLGSTHFICKTNSGQGGRKGEGIADFSTMRCRGKQATGGGGGNDQSGGGGGGSYVGAGGNGGYGWRSNDPCTLSDEGKGGQGGLSLEGMYEDEIAQLFLGGGGGSGHQSNKTAYRAGNGGGIIFLKATRLKVSAPNRMISARGEDAMNVYKKDGGSGGGAGGAIILDIGKVEASFANLNSFSLDVSGGKGSDIYCMDHQGPGGGGGGGIICAPQTLLGQIPFAVQGGKAGIFLSLKGTQHPLHETTHGARDGSPGKYLRGAPLFSYE